MGRTSGIPSLLLVTGVFAAGFVFIPGMGSGFYNVLIYPLVSVAKRFF